MRNSKTKRVYDYWLKLKGPRCAPERRDIAPRSLRGMLPFIFIAERMGPGLSVFRLAGTGLCERYGRELRDHNLDALWSPADRPALRRFVDDVLDIPAPGLVTFRAETIDRRSVSGEMLFLPLCDEEGTVSRLLGCAFATQSTSWLGQRPLVHQFMETASLISSATELAMAPPQPAPPAVRQHKHLRLVVSNDTPLTMAPEESPSRSLGS